MVPLADSNATIITGVTPHAGSNFKDEDDSLTNAEDSDR